MGFLLNNCTFKVYDSELINSCEPFDCGNTDLNDFFRNDSLNYHSVLLGKSYCFTLDENPKIIVCAFTISNDSIKTFTIVKNDGNIEVLTKLKGYDRLSLLTELQRMGKKRIKTGSDSEYRKVIDKFLSKHQEGGLFEWKK